MSHYDNFACCYDVLMADAQYEKRADYILKLFSKYGDRPTLLLDAACGTGAFSNAFAKKGIEVIGTDMSQEMLSVARENSAEEGLDVLYLCQKMQNLDLYGTVDGAVCLMDSVNHITEKEELLKAFGKISLFLEKGKLFIFDVNTPYKHEKVLGNNTFALEAEGVYCVWQNEYDAKTREVQINLDFFIEAEGFYIRSGECFKERAYTIEELTDLLTQSGLEVRAVLGDLSLEPPKEQEERIFFVTVKKQR